MSFGFAVGDFIAAGKLIQDVVSILRTAARAEYRELILELHGLQQALDHVERLKVPPERHASITSIKVAALTCTHVLDGFWKKLRKFEDLSVQHGTSKATLLAQKLRWGFTMSGEVRNLRTYLLAHVGYLNMRLVTEGISSNHLITQSIRDAEANIIQHVSRTLMTHVQSNITAISTTITSKVVPQMTSLLEFMNKIWQCNVNIVSLLTMILEKPSPALQYTWFQAPVKFEDALGRVLPIPSEFDWLKFEAIIFAHFASGPGREKVKAGEYELFDPLDRDRIISKTTPHPLRPGMSVVMAFIVGKYSHRFGFGEDDRCPRPGCSGVEFRSLGGNEKRCAICDLSFGIARTELPQPHRANFFAAQTSTNYLLSLSHRKTRKRRRQFETRLDRSDDSFHKQFRSERLSFKNIRLVYTPLPHTPQVKNIRRATRMGLYHIIYLSLLCQRRGWSDPVFQTFRTRHGYGATVHANDRDFSTDVDYESDDLARNAAATRAYMILRNFSVSDGVLPGRGCLQAGIVQGLPVPIGTGRRYGSNISEFLCTASDASVISSGAESVMSTWSAPQGRRGRRLWPPWSSAGL